VDIVVSGRNVEVHEHFRAHVIDKMAGLERYDSKIIRYEVELYHENNPRLSKIRQRVEITGKGAGSPVRAEACGPDFYAAFHCAINKLEERLRRVHDRRTVHYGPRHPTSVAEATAPLAGALLGGESGIDQLAATDPHEHTGHDQP
jgi:ribosomal subunit interface protein